jgi:N-acetylglucosamine-6-phosphate deacetylase
MTPGRNNPSGSDEHAVLAHRMFDGQRWHVDAAVLVRDGRIVGVAPRGEVPSAWPKACLPDGVFLAPGYIDLQVNGGGGILLNDQPTADGMRAIAQAHRRYGTTACLPTLITDTREQMQAAIAAARAVAGREGVLGVHLEGPFISPKRPGVHRPDLIRRPDAALHPPPAGEGEDDLDLLCELGGIGGSLLTLAPECVPAGFVRTLSSCGVRVSIGHSEASVAIVMQALADGATGVTHLFNAMPPMSARDPGIIGATLAERALTAGLIVDGVHVDPVSVRAAFAAKGCDRIALVTDAMPTVGTSLAGFELMGRNIRLTDGRLTTEAGTLAGAHLDMATAVRNAVELAQLPLADALRAASLTPARFLGLEHERGALVPGARADLVALSGDLRVVATWLGGENDRPGMGSIQ